MACVRNGSSGLGESSVLNASVEAAWVFAPFLLQICPSEATHSPLHRVTRLNHVLRAFLLAPESLGWFMQNFGSSYC